jgi:hypothetical protein
MVIVEESAKPVPDTVTVEPTLPLVGLRVMAEVTVNVAESVLALASVIVTVLAPVVEAGTVNVALVNEPVLLVLVVPLRVTGTPSKVAVIVLEPAKPVPDTVTVEPTFPLVGLSVMAGITVNEADPDLELASVIMTVLAPAVWVGTVNVAAGNEPVASVVVVPLRVTAEPANVAVIVLEPVQPVPETVTVEPTFPLAGLRVIDGLTVKVAVGELVPSVAWTVWLPYTDAGTVNVAENEP